MRRGGEGRRDGEGWGGDEKGWGRGGESGRWSTGWERGGCEGCGSEVEPGRVKEVEGGMGVVRVGEVTVGWVDRGVGPIRGPNGWDHIIGPISKRQYPRYMRSSLNTVRASFG